jgi:hypothetical protein
MQDFTLLKFNIALSMGVVLTLAAGVASDGSPGSSDDTPTVNAATVGMSAPASPRQEAGRTVRQRHCGSVTSCTSS